MHPDAGKLLWDAQQAVERVARFTATKSFADYEADDYFRSAFERKFEVVGEALNQLSRLDGSASDPPTPGLHAARRVLPTPRRTRPNCRRRRRGDDVVELQQGMGLDRAGQCEHIDTRKNIQRRAADGAPLQTVQ